MALVNATWSTGNMCMSMDLVRPTHNQAKATFSIINYYLAE